MLCSLAMVVVDLQGVEQGVKKTPAGRQIRRGDQRGRRMRPPWVTWSRGLGLPKAVDGGTLSGLRFKQISFDLGYQERGRDVEAVGNSICAAHREISHPPFDVADVSSMQSGTFGQLLLA